MGYLSIQKQILNFKITNLKKSIYRYLVSDGWQRCDKIVRYRKLDGSTN